MAQKALRQKLETLFQSQQEVAELLINSGSKSQENGSWSPHQVLQHIVSSQAGTIKVLARKKEKNDYKNIPLSHKFNFLLLRLFFGFNFKTKAPSVLPPPTEDVSLNELKEILTQQHQNFSSELGQISPQLMNKAVFRHPITGLMNPTMTVQFLGLHWEHHKKQILSRMQ